MTDARTAKIEKVIDRSTTGALQVYGAAGATTIAFQNMGEMMEFAKLLATSGPMIRPAFQGNPGACLAITMQAARWGFDPVAVIQKSYIVKNRAGEEQIAYESQLVHALVNTRAPLIGRLEISYDGEGQNLTCTVSGVLKGADGPSVYTSPPVGQIGVQNSPLWKSDVRQQIHYYSTRAWARRFVPEVILGIMTPDEIDAQEQHYGPDHAKDVTPRPSRALVEHQAAEDAKAEEPAERYPVVDESGIEYCACPSADQWAQEYLAQVGDRTAARSLGIWRNNLEAGRQILPLIEAEDLAKRLATVLDLPPPPPPASEKPAGASETPASVPAQPTPQDTPTPPKSEPPATTPTPAAPPQPVAGAGAADPARTAGSTAPTSPTPEPEPGPRSIALPMNKTGTKPDSAAYLRLILAEIELAPSPEMVDLLLDREKPNLDKVLGGTRMSIRMEAERRRNALLAEQQPG